MSLSDIAGKGLEWLNNNKSGVAAGASVAGGHLLAQDLKDTGVAAQQQMGQLAGALQNDVAFKGYGVHTGLGSTTVAADGTTTLGVGPDAGMMANADSALSAANAGFGSAASAAAALKGNGQLSAALGGLDDASALAGANSSNAQLNQALSGLQQAQGMANTYSSNAQMGQATGLLGGSLQGVAGQQAGAFGASQQAMQSAMQSTAGREQDIYNRAMAMQQPGLDAQRAQQQAREYAMGRGGVRGSQFGGTAEDAATARAQAQAMNQASFQAMSQGQQEMMNQGQLASSFGQMGYQGQQAQAGVGSALGSLGAQNAQLGQSAANMFGQFANQQGQLGAQNAQLGQSAANLQGQFANQKGQLGAAQAQQEAQNAQLMASIAQQQGALGLQQNQQAYLPMSQQLQALQLGQANAGMSQSGDFTGAGYAAQLGLGGMQADINAQKAATELYGNMFDSILDNV